MATRYALGVDIGGSSIKTVLAEASGRAVVRRQDPTPPGVEAVVALVVQAVSRIERSVARGEVLDGEVVVGPGDVARCVGVDLPGIVDEASGTAVLSVNLGWSDVPMGGLLSQALARPVAFGHDVRSGAWAEYHWGAASDNCMYLALGTGIAAAFIIEGRQVTSGGWAGEIGQALIADPDHPGQLTRFEKVASARALAQRLALTRPEAEREGTLAAGALGVEFALESGDPHAVRIWRTALDAQAEVIARSVCMLGPLDVIVGGGLMRAGDALLFNPLRERVAELLTISPQPRIVPATLGAWAQAMGSAGRALQAQG